MRLSAPPFIATLAFLFLPLLAQAEQTCPLPLDPIALEEGIKEARQLLLSGREATASRRLSELEAQTECLSGPASNAALGQLYFVAAIALFKIGVPAEAILRLRSAFVVCPDLEWDDELTAAIGLRNRFLSFSQTRQAILSNDTTAVFIIEQAGFQGAVFVDGIRFAASPTPQNVTPGRHLVQFPSERLIWNNVWLEFTPSSPRHLRPTKRLVPRDFFALASVESLFLPGAGLEASERELGMGLEARISSKRAFLAAWGALHPLTFAANALPNDLELAAIGLHAPILTRAGLKLGFLRQAGKVPLELTLSPAYIHVPSPAIAVPSAQPITSSTPYRSWEEGDRLYLLESASGASISFLPRLTLGRRDRVTIGLELGFLGALSSVLVEGQPVRLVYWSPLLGLGISTRFASRIEPLNVTWEGM